MGPKSKFCLCRLTPTFLAPQRPVQYFLLFVSLLSTHQLAHSFTRLGVPVSSMIARAPLFLGSWSNSLIFVYKIRQPIHKILLMLEHKSTIPINQITQQSRQDKSKSRRGQIRLHILTRLTRHLVESVVTSNIIFKDRSELKAFEHTA